MRQTAIRLGTVLALAAVSGCGECCPNGDPMWVIAKTSGPTCFKFVCEALEGPVWKKMTEDKRCSEGGASRPLYGLPRGHQYDGLRCRATEKGPEEVSITIWTSESLDEDDKAALRITIGKGD